MRRADMRDLARRRLMDDASELYTDSQIDTGLNLCAGFVQREVQKVDPDAFRRKYTRNLVNGTNRYQAPRGFLKHKYLVLDGTRASAIPEEWIIFQGDNRIAYYLSAVDAGFAITGGEYVVWPTPTADVEDGFELHYVPVLAMAEDNDDLQDYGLVEPLHTAVWLWAVKLLKPESGEKDPELDNEIRAILADIGTYYPAAPASVEPAHAVQVEGIGKELV